MLASLFQDNHFPLLDGLALCIPSATALRFCIPSAITLGSCAATRHTASLTSRPRPLHLASEHPTIPCTVLTTIPAPACIVAAYCVAE